MYTEFFKLRELPFNNTPDPRFFYSTPDHEEALASLVYAVQERKGFVLVTGEVGTGKTLVSRMMLRHFGSRIAFANINHAVRDGGDLLESICTDLEIVIEHGDSHAKLIRKLHDFLLSRFAQNVPVVLVLDEAQSLPFEAFEQLRMIGNLEADDAKLLQIVMLGQPELQRRFAKPDLRQLKQRIFRIFHLHGLTREATEGYIRSRFITAGSEDPDIFSRDAIDKIFEFSQGLPRLINAVCDNALLSAYSADNKQIDGTFIQSVIEQMMAVGEIDDGHGLAPGAVATQTVEAQPISSPNGAATLTTHDRVNDRANADVISTLVKCLATQQNQLTNMAATPQPTTPAPTSTPLATAPSIPIVDTDAIVDTVAQRIQNLWQQDVSQLAHRLAALESTAVLAPEAQDRALEAKHQLECLLERVDASIMTSKAQDQALALREQRLQKTAGKVRQVVDSLRQIMDTMKLATTKAGRAERQASRMSERLAEQTERARGLVRSLSRGLGQVELGDRKSPSGDSVIKQRTRPCASLTYDSVNGSSNGLVNDQRSAGASPNMPDLIVHARNSLIGLREVARNKGSQAKGQRRNMLDHTGESDSAPQDDPTSQLAAKTESLLALVESADTLVASVDTLVESAGTK